MKDSMNLIQAKKRYEETCTPKIGKVYKTKIQRPINRSVFTQQDVEVDAPLMPKEINGPMEAIEFDTKPMGRDQSPVTAVPPKKHMQEEYHTAAAKGGNPYARLALHVIRLHANGLHVDMQETGLLVRCASVKTTLEELAVELSTALSKHATCTYNVSHSVNMMTFLAVKSNKVRLVLSVVLPTGAET